MFKIFFVLHSIVAVSFGDGMAEFYLEGGNEKSDNKKAAKESNNNNNNKHSKIVP